MESLNFGGIFGDGKKHAVMQEKGDSREYRVSYKNGKDGVYTSLIRFVVNPRQSEKSVVSKSVSWLKIPGAPNTSRKPFDNPRSTGERDNNPIDALFFGLYMQDNVRLKDLAKECIQTSDTHASIIQVLNDAQHPEYNGRFFIFRYGKKLYEKLIAEENGSEYTQAHDPWNVFNGRAFLLECRNQGGNNNYDNSKFVDVSKGILYTTGQKDVNGNDILFEAKADTPDIQQFLYNYLMEKTPILEDYDYKPWDNNTLEEVNGILRAIENVAYNGGANAAVPQMKTEYTQIQQPVQQASYTQPIQVPVTNPMAQPMSMSDMFSAPTPQQQVNSVPVSSIPVPNLGTATPTVNTQTTDDDMPKSQFGDLSSLVHFE